MQDTGCRMQDTGYRIQDGIREKGRGMQDTGGGEIERELDISWTYYFRSTKEAFKASIMQEIEKMGYEVGYHYEVLDKAKGNYGKAIEIFEAELKDTEKRGNSEL